MPAVGTRRIRRAQFLAAAKGVVRAALLVAVEQAKRKAEPAQAKRLPADTGDKLTDGTDERMALALAWLMAHEDEFFERSKKTAEEGAVKLGLRRRSNLVVSDEEVSGSRPGRRRPARRSVRTMSPLWRAHDGPQQESREE